jgi:hypothetical protein
MVSQSKSKYKSNAGDILKPKDGRNRYRLIAPRPEQASWVPASCQFWADLGVHWIKPAENAKPIAVVGDREIVYQEPNPINTAINAAIDSAVDEESQELYKGWRSRHTVLVNVVDRDNNDNEEILELTRNTFSAVLDLMDMYAEEGQDITDPNEGIDIFITRTGKGLNTEYTVSIAPGKSQPIPEETVTNATNLFEFIEQKFFRMGDEQKALNAIQQIAGVAVPSLENKSAASTPTAALTSSAATVGDADESEPEKAKAKPETPPQAETQVSDDELAASGIDEEDTDQILSELDGI